MSGACREVLPGLDGVESGRGEPAVGAECIVAQQQKRGRLVGLDRGDDGFSCLGRIAGLDAVRRSCSLRRLIAGDCSPRGRVPHEEQPRQQKVLSQVQAALLQPHLTKMSLFSFEQATAAISLGPETTIGGQGFEWSRIELQMAW
jgi:hypothetical protein